MFQEAWTFYYGFYLFNEYLVGKEEPIKNSISFYFFAPDISGILVSFFSWFSSVQVSKHF